MYLRIVRLTLLVVLTIALGCAILFCVTRVGDLNTHAAYLQACQKASNPVNGCAAVLPSSGQISSLHDEANTLGELGWAALGVLVFGIGGSVLRVLKGG